jgi:hypothetical protein
MGQCLVVKVIFDKKVDTFHEKKQFNFEESELFERCGQMLSDEGFMFSLVTGKVNGHWDRKYQAKNYKEGVFRDDGQRFRYSLTFERKVRSPDIKSANKEE